MNITFFGVIPIGVRVTPFLTVQVGKFMKFLGGALDEFANRFISIFWRYDDDYGDVLFALYSTVSKRPFVVRLELAMDGSFGREIGGNVVAHPGTSSNKTAKGISVCHAQG